MLSCARSAYSWSFAFRAAYGMRNTVQIRAGSFGWLHIKHQNGERHGCRYQDGPVRVHEKPLIRWDFHARDSLQGLQRMVRKKQKTSSERQSCERKRRVESGSEENDPTGPGNSYKSRFTTAMSRKASRDIAVDDYAGLLSRQPGTGLIQVFSFPVWASPCSRRPQIPVRRWRERNPTCSSTVVHHKPQGLRIPSCFSAHRGRKELIICVTTDFRSLSLNNGVFQPADPPHAGCLV